MDIRTTGLAANDNTPPADQFAFAIGETIEVMTRAVIMEQTQSATGRSYLVKATKDDGREIYIRASETDIFEAEPTAERAAA